MNGRGSGTGIENTWRLEGDALTVGAVPIGFRIAAEQTALEHPHGYRWAVGTGNECNIRYIGNSTARKPARFIPTHTNSRNSSDIVQLGKSRLSSTFSVTGSEKSILNSGGTS
jgi:hypothetical protein